MKRLTLMLSILISGLLLSAQGYKVGDEALNFELINIDEKTVSLSDYADEKGVIVVFTCNHCPYSIAYEDRLIELNKKYKAKGYPMVAINPNDPELYPSDSFDEMKVRSKEKGFTFPYLFDEKQDIFPVYGATKTPHIYLLKNEGGKFKVAYIGAIDDSPKDEKSVKKTYLADAIDALLADEVPNPSVTKAVGCGIKVKK